MKIENSMNKIVLILLILSSAAFLTSCSEDENNGQVVLLSFGPAGAHHGDQIKFIGQNLNKVSSIVFPGAEVDASNFASQSSQLIEVVIPDAAEAGKVILKTDQGDIETKTVLSFNVMVVINSITSTAKPGTDITIEGDMINWIESITFNEDLEVMKADFVSQSLHELVVTVPIEAKTGFLSFISGGTKPTAFESEAPLVVKLPEVTSMTPNGVRHTENLTITGTDLDLVTKIDFPSGGTVLSSGFESQSETQIVVAVPATTVNGKLTLTAPSGVEVVTANSITIVLPNITTFSPSDEASQVAGNTLTMTGTDLDLVAKIKFPGVTDPVTTFTSHTATQIDVVIPAGAEGGTVVLVTIHDFIVPVTLPFGNQLVLQKIIYDDAVNSPFGAGGGWGGVTTDAASTENPRVGTKSVKVTFAGSWGGGCQFGTWGNSPLSTSGTTAFAFSIYGGTGSDGKKVNVNVSGVQKEVVVQEGTWQDITILLSDVGSPTELSEVWFQDQGWAGVVFIDHIGLK